MNPRTHNLGRVNLTVRALLSAIEEIEQARENLEGKIVDAIADWAHQHYDGRLDLVEVDEDGCEIKGPPEEELRWFIKDCFGKVVAAHLLDEAVNMLIYDENEWPNGTLQVEKGAA
jgi:hypothetical protein